MNYRRTRFVGGPQLGTATTGERADALTLRLAQLAAERQESRETLLWDRVGSDE